MRVILVLALLALAGCQKPTTAANLRVDHWRGDAQGHVERIPFFTELVRERPDGWNTQLVVLEDRAGACFVLYSGGGLVAVPQATCKAAKEPLGSAKVTAP